MPPPLAPKYLIIKGESGTFALLLNSFKVRDFYLYQREIFSQNIYEVCEKPSFSPFDPLEMPRNALNRGKGEKY